MLGPSAPPPPRWGSVPSAKAPAAGQDPTTGGGRAPCGTGGCRDVAVPNLAPVARRAPPAPLRGVNHTENSRVNHCLRRLLRAAGWKGRRVPAPATQGGWGDRLPWVQIPRFAAFLPQNVSRGCFCAPFLCWFILAGLEGNKTLWGRGRAKINHLFLDGEMPGGKRGTDPPGPPPQKKKIVPPSPPHCS